MFDAIVPGEDERVLENDADVLAQVGQAQLLDVDAVEQDAALLDVVETRHQADDRGLARARGAHDGDALPCANPEIDVAQHPVLVDVRKRDVLERDLAAHVLEDGRLCGIRDLGVRVEDAEDPLRRGHRLLEEAVLLGEILDRLEELVDQLPEREQRPDRRASPRGPTRRRR